MKIIAISGRLRATFINSAFCRAAARLSPKSKVKSQKNVTVFTGLGELPLFNPGLELCFPHSVHRFRPPVGQARAVIVASPEYAHGSSGAMKNALDGRVGFEGMVAKPVALIHISPRASHADAALQEVLKTMATNIVAEASISLPLLG